MRRTDHDGSFFKRLVINMILNVKWAVPGIILLVLHIFRRWPLGLSITAFGIWILAIMIMMKGIAFSEISLRVNDPEKENKNPYSNKGMEKTDKNISDK